MRITSMIVVVAVFVTASLVDADLTWVPWETTAGGNNHEYALSTTGANWATHQATAESLGAYLATMNTEAENTFVTDNVLHLTSSHWMGLYDADGDNGSFSVGWEWVDGDPLEYDSEEGWQEWENWASGQPDGYAGGTWGGYAYIRGGTGEWHDWQGGANYWAVYERTIPEPGTLLMVLCGVAAVGLKRRLKS